MSQGKNVTESVLMKKIENLQIQPTEKWAIYGTGEASIFLCKILEKNDFLHSINYVIDRDDKVYPGTFFCSMPLVKLLDVVDSLDGILIAAYVNHKIIEKRICENLSKKQAEKIRIVDIFTYSTKEDRLKYVDYLENQILKKQEEFIAYEEEAYCKQEKDTKLIAWYLPQFHQIEINNKFHGQGFTEWTNTTRAMPMFTGHYQPHIPYDVGYYDLLNIDTFKRQIYLAKHYGIYGFCMHYYWFSGKRIMEKPLEIFLNHKELDMPFCFNWATENWTSLWDAGNNGIMYEQKFSVEETEGFMEDILPYMKDSRYIKIDGRPLLVLYRVNQFKQQEVISVIKNLRKKAKQAGFPDLYIMLTNARGFMENVIKWGADAIVEFPPCYISSMMESYIPSGYINPNFSGVMLDATSFIENKQYMFMHENTKYFRSVLTSWDNTARKALSGASIMCGLSPKTFKIWLKDVILESKRIHTAAENFVFLNSWNEWAEGSHLEPDMKYGYAWLQACVEALEETRELE